MKTPHPKGCAAPKLRGRGAEAGSALLVTVTLIAVFSLAVGIAVSSTANVGRNADRTRNLQSGIAVGDAYLEWAYAQWRATCRGQGNTALPGSSFAGISSPTANWLPQPTGYTVSNFGIAAVDVEGNPQNASTPPPAAQGEDSGDNSYYYKASVNVSVPTTSRNPVNVKMRRIFEKHIASPWRYAIFYNDTLEMHPSPTFSVNGWVHTNDSLYAAPDGGNPLKFLDKVTYSDFYYQGYAPGDYAWRGRSSPAGAAPTFAPGIPGANEARSDFFGITPDQFSTTDSNDNNDGYRELIERPDPNYADPLTNSNGDNPRLYDTASVKVLVNGANAITVMKADGTVVSSASPNPADKLLYTTVAGAITTNQSIQDYREAASVRLVTVDVSQLQTANIAGWNGVLYVSDTSAGQTGGTPKRGVRLKNGSQLPTGGLTVVSDNPVYIQGNYNTAGTRQPSAVIGDAVMVLSQNWSDANSSADLNGGKRTATATTINTAILAGITPTDPSLSPSNTAYSGGVENFPRFMENWSGVNFTYNGSMVELFASKQAIGRWGSSSQAYNPPNRIWAFDPMFRTNPPPGSLFTTTYIKQRWYLE